MKRKVAKVIEGQYVAEEIDLGPGRARDVPMGHGHPGPTARRHKQRSAASAATYTATPPKPKRKPKLKLIWPVPMFVVAEERPACGQCSDCGILGVEDRKVVYCSCVRGLALDPEPPPVPPRRTAGFMTVEEFDARQAYRAAVAEVSRTNG